MNRIRKLYRKTFERYSDITLLYLFENMIHWIEEGTFSQLSDLQVSGYVQPTCESIFAYLHIESNSIAGTGPFNQYDEDHPFGIVFDVATA